MEYKKHGLDAFYLTLPFEFHDILKPTLLGIMESVEESLNQKDDYYTDEIYKLDWNNASDMSRPWVQALKPLFDAKFSHVAACIGYKESKINEIWFQQYLRNSTHGWHTHGSNFTVVYYLELDERSPKTELIDPLTQSVRIVPDVKEGDILIFPSFAVHRAPALDNDIRKTIVSCNIDFLNPHQNLLDSLNVATNAS